ncbi:hypothetical protein MIN45_P0623 [Methylomarinovum tepidoasis]|uniref:ATP-dependent exonuclease SbcCD, C subunit-like protein n=1 Tax=Methylomarinovum tepidoasis TaxID=2840183 RepID=A0AAU9CZX9_9GAMM|nr:ATP-binding protein [Methylomarinovum sp. IN45]BCX88254.1 hypothetical protein MIN45_P0623 [Methylomarinovum sp. IN45]
MAAQIELLPFAAGDRPGFRLHRLEVCNWGTFHDKVWKLEPAGADLLLTGDIGSGKSTLVDALTTLLVPPQKLAYNRAAGAEARERDFRSYVLGYYKSARSEEETGARGAKPVSLRDASCYSVILAHFRSEDLDQDLTLAQVFWFRDPAGQPARFYVLAERALAIAEHFGGFGGEIGRLKKRLRQSGCELFDSFSAYAGAFRRRLGIPSELALELFHQTVSMKSVGNLTGFVRRHMLEPPQVQRRIEALVAHFDDLTRAHQAILKARDQIGRLKPLVADCDRHQQLEVEADRLRQAREALGFHFAALKRELLAKRLEKLAGERDRCQLQLAEFDRRRGELQARRDELRQAIAAQGGDRLARLEHDIGQKERECQQRRRQSENYAKLAAALGLPSRLDAATFVANRKAVAAEREALEDRRAELQNRYTDASVEFRRLNERHRELSAEIESLEQRRSNIPARMQRLRQALCQALELAEDELPFAGELLQVREDERAWEGAAERLLHQFGLSLLVPDAHYAAVSAWVDRTHLDGRLVYYRVREQVGPRKRTQPDSLVDKLEIKPDSAFYPWLERELSHRFDYRCCDDLADFRRADRAVTVSGQIKSGGDRHEKDDRHRIGDRRHYVLGWSNAAKLAALRQDREALETQIQQTADNIAALERERRDLETRQDALTRLAQFDDFQLLDWQPLALELEALQRQFEALKAASDVLRTLQAQLEALEAELKAVEKQRDDCLGDIQAKAVQIDQCRAQLAECETLLADCPAETEAALADLRQWQAEALGDARLILETCDARERDYRAWLGAAIDRLDKRIGRLRERIVRAMTDYRHAYPADTREVDADPAAAADYRAMLETLERDDLPRFEARFRALLNENTLREVANFQAHLYKERQAIRERIDAINQALHGIDYNPGRYIRLEARDNVDPDIRDFRRELRLCTEGALTAGDDPAEAEARFLRVKALIERFRGREGSAESDRRWTAQVTDVRNWFVFAASERWREDDSEHEHYADSSGKSGGQKEKLAYTVLAASLAYQFGLATDPHRPRSFRLVVIDEAFGRGSDESARYGLALFQRLGLQLLIVTPLQKIHVIEPYVAAVGFVFNREGRQSLLRQLTVEAYRAERDARQSIGE